MEIIAHRGASHDAPENTLAAARLAWAQGADALECDVRLTADGRIAVMHDADLQRVAGAAATVRSLRWAELQEHDVGAWKHPRFEGERVPDLAALVATVPEDRRIFIEVKDGPATMARVAEGWEQRAGPKPRVVIITFDFAVATAAKARLPSCEVAWIVDAPAKTSLPLEALIEKCRTAGLDALDLERSWSPAGEVVSRVHAAQLKLYVWTVDDAAEARRWRDAGVDGITTNRSAWLRAQLA